MQTCAAVRNHWPEYLMEAAGLGCYMVSACLFTALFVFAARLRITSLAADIGRGMVRDPDGHAIQVVEH